MKKLLTVTGVAVAMALVAVKAMGGTVMPYQYVVNISGTADIQKAVGTNEATEGTYSINDKLIYYILTNALINASADSDGAIASTNPPTGSYIAFNPIGSDGGPTDQGFFYVTNRNGFSWPLSGFDSTGTNYYSFMELDTWHDYYPPPQAPYYGFGFGFTGLYAPAFGGVTAWKVNNKGSGSQTDHVTALLYVHDDPYAYDDADTAIIWLQNYNLTLNGGLGAPQGGGYDTTITTITDLSPANNNALEIRGILSDSFSFNTNGVSSASAKLTGSGNFLYAKAPYNSYGNTIENATLTLTK
jgi:hypothetical protein